MGQYAITVKNLTKIYKIYNKPSERFKEALSITKRNYHKDYYAISNVSFAVPKGQIYGIMGTNGSGKSTILKIITGVLTASEGEVIVNGKVAALLELGTGFNPEYTGTENIYLNGMMMGFSREEMDERLDEIVRFASIGEFIDQPVKTYSSGMFARLAFAVSINVDPDILIIDEALSVGDFFFQAKCYRKFEEFRSNGKTILFVSHDMNSMLKYCDRVLLLNNGVQVIEDEPGKVIDTYKRILSGVVETDPAILDEDELETTVSLRNRLDINAGMEDYGSKVAEIIDFAIINDEQKVTNSINKNTEFEIYMKVKFNSDIDNPIFAFTIRDVKGNELMGTNTLLEEIFFGIVKAGSVYIVRFKQRMQLQPFSYLLCLGCTGFEGAGLTVYHRLYDICRIDVVGTKTTIGFYDCGSVINYSTSAK